MAVAPVTRPARDCLPNLLDLEAERASYRIEVPDHFNAVLDIVEKWASEDPDALAVLSLDGVGDVVAEQSAADLARASRQAARALLDLGVGKGDHVFVMLPRIPEWYAALLGAMRIGAIPMPGPNLLTPKDIAYRFGRTGATAAITDEAGAGKVDAGVPGLRTRLCVGGGARGLAVVRGTLRRGRGRRDARPTRPPRRPTAAVLHQRHGVLPEDGPARQSYALGHIGTARFWHDLRRGDLHWTVTDTGWAKAAWGGLFGQMHERAAILHVALGTPDADTIFGILARHRVTLVLRAADALPAAGPGRLLASTTSRRCGTARARASRSIPRSSGPGKEGTGGLTIYDGYGQTETTCLVANYRAMPVRPGSMGRPVPG